MICYCKKDCAYTRPIIYNKLKPKTKQKNAMNPYLSSSHSPRSLHPKLPHCQSKRNIFSVSKPSVTHFLLRHDSPSRRLQSPDTITGLGRVSCFDSRERSSEKVSQILCQLYFPWFSHHTSKGYCSKSMKSFSCFGIFIPKKVGK